jgi:hypothetical protein
VAAEGDTTGGSFAIEAHVTNPSGHDDIVRLHPTMERGTLEGSVATSLPGVYAVTVTLANGAHSQTTFVTNDDAFTLGRLRPCFRGGAGVDRWSRCSFVGSLAARAPSVGYCASGTPGGRASNAIGVVDGRIRRRPVCRMDAAAAQRFEVTT